LLLAGDTPSKVLRHNQDVDQTAIFNSVGVALETIRCADTVVVDLTRAFNRALAAQRPSAVQFPTDMQDLTCDTGALQSLSVRIPPASRPVDRFVNIATDLIMSSKRPAIVAGRGAVRSNARAPLERLAEQTGALLATTAQAKGLFMGNPYYLGSSGGFASPLGERLLSQADLILAFGASLNYWTTRNRELFAPSSRIVHCDAERSAIGALTPIDLALVGDAATTAEALSDELARRGANATGFRTADTNEIAAFRLDDFQDLVTAAQSIREH
jgi:thiamine pyrophosphate-dependent acetolactate synthase large subunit-like protein